MAYDGELKKLVEDFGKLKSDMESIKEEMGRMSESLEKTCSKVQFLGVADELSELRKEVATVSQSVHELKRFIEQVVAARSPVGHVVSGISPNRASGFGAPVRPIVFDDVRRKINSDFSSPRASNTGDGSASSGRETKYGKVRVMSLHCFY